MTPSSIAQKGYVSSLRLHANKGIIPTLLDVPTAEKVAVDFCSDLRNGDSIDTAANAAKSDVPSSIDQSVLETVIYRATLSYCPTYTGVYLNYAHFTPGSPAST